MIFMDCTKDKLDLNGYLEYFMLPWIKQRKKMKLNNNCGKVRFLMVFNIFA